MNSDKNIIAAPVSVLSDVQLEIEKYLPSVSKEYLSVSLCLIFSSYSNRYLETNPPITISLSNITYRLLIPVVRLSRYSSRTLTHCASPSDAFLKNSSICMPRSDERFLAER